MRSLYFYLVSPSTPSPTLPSNCRSLPAFPASAPLSPSHGLLYRAAHLNTGLSYASPAPLLLFLGFLGAHAHSSLITAGRGMVQVNARGPLTDHNKCGRFIAPTSPRRPGTAVIGAASRSDDRAGCFVDVHAIPTHATRTRQQETRRGLSDDRDRHPIDFLERFLLYYSIYFLHEWTMNLQLQTSARQK